VDCEQAVSLLSARLDNELPADDRVGLDRHLDDCPACRATAGALSIQHEELTGAFAPRRAAAVATAERVKAALPAGRVPAKPRGGRRSWVGPTLAAAAVAGAIAAAVWLFVGRSLNFVPSVQPLPRDGPESERLVARPRPDAPPVAKLSVGETVETKAGERRRLTLPDGTVVYLNENTKLTLKADRHATMSKGTVYLNVAPRTPEEDGSTFTLDTSAGEVKAFGTKFQVSTDPDGNKGIHKHTDIVVTQGHVKYRDVEISAGQRFLANPMLSSVRDMLAPVPAPRASHLLDWTQDLMAAAESPLVPGSEYDGGALVAVDPYGQEAKLSLRKYHVDVHIEDGFARTTIDQTYFNNHPWRLEGTFYFPLPPDASLSRLAMYVGGDLMEGGMAERDYANAVYEQIVRSQRDPALLEWVDGSTFKMRVFPLEGRQEKRIVLSYTQKLPTLYGRTSYRFPAGHSLQLVDHWSFHGRVKNGAGLAWASASHPDMRPKTEGADLVLDAADDGAKVDRDVTLDLAEGSADGGFAEKVRFSRADYGGAAYLMLRYRPELTGAGERKRRDWVFLFESSADRDPLLARTQIEIIRNLLQNVEHDDTFSVVTAGTLTHRFADGPLPATPENVNNAVAFLEKTHLIGSLDLGRALTDAEPLLRAGGNPYLVHVGSGMTAMGRRQEELAPLLPDGVKYIGVGVGKRWGRSWMKQLAERTGGFFTQINPDEAAAWRAFDLLSTLNTPRLLDVKVTTADGGELPRFLTFNALVAQGEEVCAVARVDASPDGVRRPPASVVVTGTVDGRSFRKELAVEKVTTDADYLPRTWAKLEIDRLLEMDANKHKPAIIDLSKAMYVMTPFTSLLVLENEAMYQQFKVDRGRKDHWAMYDCPAKIPVVYEPDATQPVDVRNAPKLEKPVVGQVAPTVVRRGELTGIEGRRGRLQSASEIEGREKLKKLADFRGEGLAEKEWSKDSPRGEASLKLLEFGAPQLSRLGFDSAVLGREADKKHFQDNGRLLFGAGVNSDAGLTGSVGFRSNDPLGNRGRSGARNFFADTLHDDVFDSRQTPVLTGGTLTIGGMLRRSEARDSHIPFPNEPSIRFPDDGKKKDRKKEDWDTIRSSSPAPDSMIVPVTTVRGWITTSSGGLVDTAPSFTDDRRRFSDLIAYAPGLNSTDADLRAVFDAEAAPDLADAPGHVDPAARELIDRSRTPHWQTLTIAGENGRPALRYVFDGTGRYAYDRTLSLGLKERVVCDGTTLWHLYPELGLAGRRTVSRFHRAEANALTPWTLPPADDLARGADVEQLDDRTVALVPLGAKTKRTNDDKPAPYWSLHLVFAADGRLAERRLVEAPTGKVLWREVYDGKEVRLLDADGKELAKETFDLADAAAADLAPDVKDLVVLPMPFRSREFTFAAFGFNPNLMLSDDANACYTYLEGEQRVTLLASTLADGRGDEARLVFRNCFAANGDLRSGLFTILASYGVAVCEEPAFAKYLAGHKDEPLARYLAIHGNKAYESLHRRLLLDLGGKVGPADSFLGRLAEFHDLETRWSADPSRWLRGWAHRGDAARMLDYVHRNRDNALGRAMLTVLENRAPPYVARPYADMAAAWADIAEVNKGEDYGARYEQARCLVWAGRDAEGRKLFLELHASALKEGVLPPIDHFFRQTLDLDKGDGWAGLMQKTVGALIEKKDRPGAVAVAWQCRQVGDGPLSDVLLSKALDGLTDDDRLEATLAAVQYLSQTDQLAPADELLKGLLENATYAKEAGLWRLASSVADRRGMAARGTAYLERALTLESRDLPPVIDLQQWRTDYGRLLDHYQTLSTSLAATNAAAPADLATKTVWAADQWRAHDPETGRACQTAANILKTLGRREEAWEYLTTPSGATSNTAESLSREGDLDLSDRAFAVACERDPTDASLVWRRAHNLRQGGRAGESDRLLRRLAEEKWPPQYISVQARAKQELERR
jgi:ferric-dicitrate binding protein FerR (iron transport regulator)